MKNLKISQKAIDIFKNVAISNYKNGDEIETLAYFLGKEEHKCIEITTIVFPDQKGTATYVDDEGIEGQDSIQWMLTNLVQKKDLCLVLWVHCHVKGAPCGFSSVDIHTQYLLEYNIPSIKGLVIEMDSNTIKTLSLIHI